MVSIKRQTHAEVHTIGQWKQRLTAVTREDGGPIKHLFAQNVIVKQLCMGYTVLATISLKRFSILRYVLALLYKYEFWLLCVTMNHFTLTLLNCQVHKVRERFLWATRYFLMVLSCSSCSYQVYYVLHHWSSCSAREYLEFWWLYTNYFMGPYSCPV